MTVSAYVGQLEEEISRRGEELERASLHLEKLEGVRTAQEAAIRTLEARIRELEARLTEEEGACVPTGRPSAARRFFLCARSEGIFKALEKAARHAARSAS